ncbi:MAG: hypothetical protein ABL932_20220, partial [Terricaulis sp.]
FVTVLLSTPSMSVAQSTPTVARGLLNETEEVFCINSCDYGSGFTAGNLRRYLIELHAQSDEASQAKLQRMLQLLEDDYETALFDLGEVASGQQTLYHRDESLVRSVARDLLEWEIRQTSLTQDD